MTSGDVNRYQRPQRWMRHDPAAIMEPLIAAKTAAGILSGLPYLPQWIEQVHEEQLRLEAVSTSRIEGAEFSQREEDEALAPESITRSDLTHSQLQLRAAESTYRWLRSQPADRPVDDAFILEVHRRFVTGCDDHHCEPGALRPSGWNVTFGSPQCRGVEGGDECHTAFGTLCNAIAGEFTEYDRIIQAMALHYHIGAMHPFGDGNGRTARGLEAFMLRRAGVNELVMVSLSNYYYEHKEEYLAALSASRRSGHDLTPFLRFALPAVAQQCRTVASTIIENHKRTLFRQFAVALFGRLRTPRRRVLVERQLAILESLLETEVSDPVALIDRTASHYNALKYPGRAQIRDIIDLFDLGALQLHDDGIRVNLDWPQQFSESELIEQLEQATSAASNNRPGMAALQALLNRHS